MRKTPSYLKGLAETRARAFADVQRLRKLQVELAKNLADAEAEVCSGLMSPDTSIGG